MSTPNFSLYPFYGYYDEEVSAVTDRENDWDISGETCDSCTSVSDESDSCFGDNRQGEYDED